MVLPSLPLGPFAHLSAVDRQRSLRRTLQRAPERDEIWVFAYGSLMWNPCFAVAERYPATLPGFARAFSIYTVEARGTPMQPGLGLALQPGDTCQGVVMRVAEHARDEGLERLWAREMLTGIYVPLWVEVQTPHRSIDAVTFVVNSTHAQYAGDLPLPEQVALIRAARGRAGSCRDYLANTVAALSAEGIDDLQLLTLLALVDT